jgi:protein-tyrosine phosphatase
MPPSLSFPQLVNARDLGGYPTRDGQVTRTHSLVRADDLWQLTPAGLRALQDYGIRTVVDLRWPEEAARNPNPVPQALPAVRFEHVSLLTHTEDEWRVCTVLERVRQELRHVLAVIARADAAGLLFHCVAGKDRTGLIAALLLALADVEPGAIASDYVQSAENLRETYLKRYADADPARILEALRCPEQGAYNMLKFLENAGGIRAYLRDIGLTQDEIAALRARLRG